MSSGRAASIVLSLLDSNIIEDCMSRWRAVVVVAVVLEGAIGERLTRMTAC